MEYASLLHLDSPLADGVSATCLRSSAGLEMAYPLQNSACTMFVNLDDGALQVIRGGYSNVSDWIPSLTKSDPAIQKNLGCSAALLEA